MEWISVKDMLPEDDARVHGKKRLKVLCYNGRCIRTETRQKNDDYFVKLGYPRWFWGKSKNDVTHWMPLPEPPKEDA